MKLWIEIRTLAFSS